MAMLAAHPLSASAQDDAPSLRGIVKAVNEATISSDLGFRIVELPFREGQSFKKDDTLAVFDCDGLRAELRSSEARQAAEQLTYDNNLRLAKLNAVGRFEVQLSKAKTDQAAAEVDTFRIKIKQCEIKAPFDGRVAAKTANVAELTDRTKPLMQIVSDDALEIEMLLPANWMRWLKPGDKFTMSLEEKAETLNAEVAAIAPVVDPVSQTIKVIGRFTDPASGILPGMSGPVRFTQPNG
ncbi:efflux RND transporter periplasmic adaptor subunit [Mesorhizobium denitrificans]|uniref:Efflux RND transporter periplasmic adaptor subunit n=2 Tax=Phyllobacteriaceae TaxID=69277 RepID=A0A371XC86_9HYPH|nr:efflux RND transporter periplasmic adaptor subunit [Mesorhizobium denitrificans]